MTLIWILVGFVASVLVFFLLLRISQRDPRVSRRSHLLSLAGISVALGLAVALTCAGLRLDLVGNPDYEEKPRGTAVNHQAQSMRER